MSYPYTQKYGSSALNSVQEEDEEPSAPPPPPHPYFFVFPEQIFGGWSNYTSGTASQGAAIRNTYYRRSWEPNHYYEYSNGNGLMRTRHHSADDLDYQDDYTQSTGNNFMNESRESGQRNNECRCLKVFIFLLAMLLVFGGMTLLALQLYESPSNVDIVSNFHGGKAYCTCECEDLADLFVLRNFYQSQEHIRQRFGRQG